MIDNLSKNAPDYVSQFFGIFESFFPKPSLKLVIIVSHNPLQVTFGPGLGAKFVILLSTVTQRATNWINCKFTFQVSNFTLQASSFKVGTLGILTT